MDRRLPRVSVIMPSFNQAAYIEPALNSILRQGYPNLELIVVDGGSRDGSVDVIRRYESALAFWVSEPDRGQAHAINKGLSVSTGDVFVYVNSDDELADGSLKTVGEAFGADGSLAWLAGSCEVFGAEAPLSVIVPEGWGRRCDAIFPRSRKQRYVFPQSGACFMRRTLMEKLGSFDEALHYSMDMEYYARAVFHGAQMRITPAVLARWRWHSQSKTLSDGVAFRFREEEVRIVKRYVPFLERSEREEAKKYLAAETVAVYLGRAAHLAGRDGSRVRALCVIGQLVLRSPRSALSRYTLGIVRRALFRGVAAS